MRPRYMTGDLVIVGVPFSDVGADMITGMVLCVLQSNNVPDAKVRGLENLQPWSYWIIGHWPDRFRCHIIGPLSQDRIKSCQS